MWGAIDVISAVLLVWRHPDCTDRLRENMTALLVNDLGMTLPDARNDPQAHLEELRRRLKARQPHGPFAGQADDSPAA